MYDFLQNAKKRVTLLGMSGVGKTRLSVRLRQDQWFHYSGDYRIGTRYLDEEMMDEAKRQAMQVPYLRDLLLSDSIYLANNLTIDHLKSVAAFLGKPGDPERGGLPLHEFKRRQSLFCQAEIQAMEDVPRFMMRAEQIYGYQHFVNDAGGSLCELGIWNDPDFMHLLEELAHHSLILYIEASARDQAALISRAEQEPKPLYYPADFFDQRLQAYKQQHGIEFIAEMDPDDFTRWIFPQLIQARIPRYRAIAQRYGCSVSSEEIKQVRDGKDFIALVEQVLKHKTGYS